MYMKKLESCCDSGSSEAGYNRRETLIKTVTNTEKKKQAKAREISKFRINRRRKGVIPKFLQRKISSLSYVFFKNMQVETLKRFTKTSKTPCLAMNERARKR